MSVRKGKKQNIPVIINDERTIQMDYIMENCNKLPIENRQIIIQILYNNPELTTLLKSTENGTIIDLELVSNTTITQIYNFVLTNYEKLKEKFIR